LYQPSRADSCTRVSARYSPSRSWLQPLLSRKEEVEFLDGRDFGRAGGVETASVRMSCFTWAPRRAELRQGQPSQGCYTLSTSFHTTASFPPPSYPRACNPSSPFLPSSTSATRPRHTAVRERAAAASRAVQPGAQAVSRSIAAAAQGIFYSKPSPPAPAPRCPRILLLSRRSRRRWNRAVMKTCGRGGVRQARPCALHTPVGERVGGRGAQQVQERQPGAAS